MRFKKRAIALIGVFVIVGVALVCLSLYRVMSKPAPVFLTTSSPNNTFTLVLKGQKKQPLFFTGQVRFDVLKNGTYFMSDRFLDSADSEDLPFEFKYPNYRWIGEQTIQLYRQESLQKPPTDTLIISNESARVVKYVRIESTDQVLVFEMNPGFTTTLSTPKTKGDLKWLRVEGEFIDGGKIPGVAKDLKPENQLRSVTYVIKITLDNTIIEIK